MKPTVTSETQELLDGLTTAINEVAAVVSSFRVQLALGEADAIQAIAAQKKKIAESLNKAENLISNLIPAATENLVTRNEIELARLKMDILRLHFHFPEMSKEACSNKIQELKTRINLRPGNMDVHDHLLTVEEEIKAAHAKSPADPKTK